MESVTFTLLLDYIYNKFAVTFVLSIIGIIIRELVCNVSKRNKVNIKKILASNIFSTALLCVIGEYFDISFSIYVILCMIVGIWSSKIVSLAVNSKFMAKVFSKVAKQLADPVIGSIADVIDENNDTNNTNTDNQKKNKKE